MLVLSYPQTPEPRGDLPHALHEPAPFHLGPPEVEHIGSQPDYCAERVQQQVDDLESHPRGKDLVKLVRKNVEPVWSF